MSVGQVLPAGRLLLGGAHEVLDVVEVDAGEVGAPGRHRLAAEQPQALEAQVEHPLRLVLLRRDVPHHVLVDRPRCAAAPAASASAQPYSYLPRAASCSSWVRGWTICSVIVSVLISGCGIRLQRGDRLGRECAWCTPRRRARWWPGAARGCRPAGRSPAVSASHSWGNSAATWATGQWCWHSCPPEAIAGRVGSVALGGQRLGERLGPGDRVVAGLAASPPGSAPPAPATWSAANALDRLRAAAARRSSAARRWPGRRRCAGRSVPGRRRSARTTLAGRPRPRCPGTGCSRAITSAVGEHRVQVPADRRRAEPELARRARRRWPRPAPAAAG